MTTLFDLRKINQNDKNEFMTMSRDFYNSDAVSAPVPENFHEQAFSDLMAGTPYAECLFFTHGNQVAGFALLAKTYSREAGGECVWVEELYLKPEFRGMGAAKTFFGKLSALYPAARYRLEVEPDNERAKKLYRACGFTSLPYEQTKKGF